MKTQNQKTTDTAEKELAVKQLLEGEIQFLQAENKRLGEVLTAIQTRHSRLLLYDTLTLPRAKQIGVNIGALVEYAFGDLTKAQLNKKVKFISGINGN